MTQTHQKKGDDSEMDAGGPSYANVPKGAKTSAQARGMKKAQDLAKSAIPKQKDIKDMSDNERQKYFSKVTTDLSAVKGPKPGGDWTVKGVQNAKIGDNSVGDILAMGFNHKDYKAAYDYTQQFQGDPPKKKKDTMQQPFYKISYTDSKGQKKTDSMRASSPGEAKKDFENKNTGRGFKVTDVESEEKFNPDKNIKSDMPHIQKRKKWMVSSDKIAKNLGYRHTAELVRDGDPDEIGEFMDSVEDIGQDWDGINYYNDNIRDNQMGVRNDDDDTLMDFRKAIFDMISMKDPAGTGKEKETGDRLKQMDAPDDYEDSTDDLMKQMGGDEDDEPSPRDD